MIYIAFGANLPARYGAPEETIGAARSALAEKGVRIVQMSSIHITAPVPVSDQPWYRNAVAQVETALEPKALLTALKSLEKEFGRTDDVRNAARVIDLDIIDYNGQIIHEEGLKLPHPRMHERGFVLYPLQELDDQWVHPVLGINIKELIENLPKGEQKETGKAKVAV